MEASSLAGEIENQKERFSGRYILESLRGNAFSAPTTCRGHDGDHFAA